MESSHVLFKQETHNIPFIDYTHDLRLQKKNPNIGDNCIAVNFQHNLLYHKNSIKNNFSHLPENRS